MGRKVPISAAKIALGSVLLNAAGIFKDEKPMLCLERKLKQYLGAENIVFLNSGLSCLYVILEVLKKDNPDKDEVVLPAYTAGSLIVAIRKAGLRPVLCDVSPHDFNMDIRFLDNVNNKTLCIIGVHMFGIAAVDIRNLTDKYPGVTVIEDVCQGMGTIIDGKPAGRLSQVSFFSFNKGKNLPTFGGGFICLRDKLFAEKIEDYVRKLKTITLPEKIKLFFKLMVLSVIVNPVIYGLLYGVIAKFKENSPPDDVDLAKYSGLQAGLACTLLKNFERQSEKRVENAARLINGLRDDQQLIFPQIADNTKPAFNRLPVVFRDLKKRQRVEIMLKQSGIETSRMYIKPLHHMFDLGYKWGNFPNAVYLGGHLLTLPCHPLMGGNDIEKMIRIIKQA